ncbi:MAG: ABC transporter permease [Bacteroidales bacterium]|nr:ABC transporter permease [Bacteroidales bacterium]
MWRGLFKIALRTIWKRKFYSFINILGLSIGIASLIFISFYIYDEMSYDRFNKNADRIYRVCRMFYTPGYVENSATCSFPLAPNLQEEYPELIDQAVRFFNFQIPSIYMQYIGRDSVKTGFNEGNFYFVDTNVFDVFSFEIVKGEKDCVFNIPQSLVLTESTAKRYFGNEEPMGKKIWLEEQLEFTVTAVIKDIPTQSHFKIDMLASMKSVETLFGGKMPETWIWNPCWTYVLLKDTVKPELLVQKFPEFYKSHYFDFQDEEIRLYLQSLTDIHLYSHIDYEMGQNGFISHIYILFAVGLFVILIASINFINLTTAISAGRAREVGVKKVIGVFKKQLVFQFLFESILMTLLALVVAIALVEILLPCFVSFTGKSFTANMLVHPFFLSIVLFLSLILGVLSGTYPAFFLSGFRPARVLKGRIAQGVKSGISRKLLVTIQYAISIALIISSVLIILQIKYVHTVNLGFDQEQTIVIPANAKVLKQYHEFKAELISDSTIIAMTGMDDILGVSHNTWGFKVDGMDEKLYFYPALMVRSDFIKTVGLQLIIGRDFSSIEKETNENEIILNESMVSSLGWTNDSAIGKKVECNGNGVVVGVVKDFNALSLHKPIGDFVLCHMAHPGLSANFTRYIVIRIPTNNMENTIGAINEKWDKYTEGRPFEYTYLQQDISQLYSNEEKFRVFSILLTIITIFLANLGTFALTSFLTEQRTKEFGMRKVLGASVISIISLYSREIFWLIIASSIIAWPLAYIITNKWFNNFAYTIDFNWWIFLLAVVFSVFVALLTVWVQAYRFAVSSPLKTLRYE